MKIYKQLLLLLFGLFLLFQSQNILAKDEVKQDLKFISYRAHSSLEGQCVYFVRQIRKDFNFNAGKKIGYAYEYFYKFIEKGYLYSNKPIKYSIFFTGKKPGNKYGHTGIVIDIYKKNGIEFIKILERNLFGSLKVSTRNLTIQDFKNEGLLGFVYFQNLNIDQKGFKDFIEKENFLDLEIENIMYKNFFNKKFLNYWIKLI